MIEFYEYVLALQAKDEAFEFVAIVFLVSVLWNGGARLVGRQ